MVNLDPEELRPRIDLEGLYVDFSQVRTSLTIRTIATNLGLKLSDPSEEGECRGSCPKCGKTRSLSVNVNTNKFMCFTKQCGLKGGGSIDFFSRLKDVSAKEASHLLAYAFGIKPYDSRPEPEEVSASSMAVEGPQGREVTGDDDDEEYGVVSRREFEEVKAKLERLSNLVCKFILENDALG